MADTPGLFINHYVDVRVFYVMKFDTMPCINFIGDIDTGQGFKHLNAAFGSELLSIYQHSYFEHNEDKMLFNNTIFELTNKRMIELGNNYGIILFSSDQYTWANKLVQEMSEFRIINSEPAIGFMRQTSVN